ncbi:MAG: hypothetical protein DRH37_01580 [Deltaproteobacteria bacterium]|nr:MAG: hypothetical protein DRH37_01580 [Deltaproteobacteria bacterium]
MHLKRLVTGLIALPILIYIVCFAPRPVFCVTLFLASVAGLWEFYRIAATDIPKRMKWSGYAFSLAVFACIQTANFFLFPALVVLLAFVMMGLVIVFPHSHGSRTVEDIGKGLLGPVYVCIPLGMLAIIDRYPHGNLWVLFELALTSSSDTGAYYCGKLFGRHKLHEALSPGKTWEGAIGGVFSSVIVSLCFLHLLRLRNIDMWIPAVAAGLAIVEQIGDLAESMFKRSHGIKDSGNILPGHGGLLDRIDGLLFVIPVFYVYFYLCIV